MSFNLALGRLHTVRQASNVEHGFLVSGWGDNVSASLVLDALDGCAFGADNETDNSVWYSDLLKNKRMVIKVSGIKQYQIFLSYLNVYKHNLKKCWSYLDCDMSRNAWRSGRRQCTGHVLTGSSDLREMFGGRQDFLLSLGHVFFASCHHEHWFFATHWSLDVSVCLGAQSFNLAT